MFSLKRRNAVVKALAAKTDNIDAAKWTEAIRLIGVQLYEELTESKKKHSETLEMINASIKSAKKLSKKRTS